MSKSYLSPYRLPVIMGWFAGYLLTMVAIYYSLNRVRDSQLAATDSQLEATWKEWRDAAAKQASGVGPVQRKIPPSRLPPVRVLFLEHFKTISVAALAFGTILYGMVYFFAQGIFARGDSGMCHSAGSSTASQRDQTPD